MFGGKTEDEFCIALDKLLTRMEEQRLTVNPQKCNFGKKRIECIGHIIDETGITFSDEKKDSVLNIPLSRLATQLRSFLGLVNYFREHIDHHTEDTHMMKILLYGMVHSNTQLSWGEQEVVQFERIKEKIHNLRKLYFLDEDYEVHLNTDASKYEIGAYRQRVSNPIYIEEINKNSTKMVCS